MTDPYSAEALNERREQHLHQLQGGGVTGDPDWQALQPASAPSDRTETPAPFVDETGFPYPPPAKGEIGNVLYAWQMRVENGWNIIGMQMPGGQTLPLVTTSLPIAWEAFEVAQAHANRNACQVRLAMFEYSSVAAIVDPNG